MRHRDVLLHPRASGAGVRGAGTWDRPPGPGAAQRVWAAPRNCSLGLGADVLAAVGFLHTAVGFYAALDSLWCRCSSSSFVEEMCLWGGRQDVHPGALPAEVGSGHLFYFVFGCHQGFDAALGIQNIKPRLVFVCQRC